MMPQEVWKPIVGYEGFYEVSNLGRVKAVERIVENNGGQQRRKERIMRLRIGRLGYLNVTLCRESITRVFSVHRLVAQAFIPNPENKPYVDHIDTDPSNNNVDNLRWVTQHENAMNPLTREHNSKSKMGHPNYLPSHSEESKRKISEKNRGKVRSEELKQRLSDIHKTSEDCLRASKENIKKAHQANVGASRSQETRAKISASHMGIHKGKHWKVENGKRIWY